MKKHLLAWLLTCLISPACVAAEETCYDILVNVSYCTDGLVLEYAPPDDPKGVTGAMPYTRAVFSNETKPFSFATFLWVPVRLNGATEIAPGDLLTLVIRNINARAWGEPEIVEARAGPAQLGTKSGVVGEFVQISPTAKRRTPFIVNAVLMGDHIFAIITGGDGDHVTDPLWAQHQKMLSSLTVLQ